MQKQGAPQPGFRTVLLVNSIPRYELPNTKTLVGTQKILNVRNTGKIGFLECTNRSCFCSVCRGYSNGDCKNAEFVDKHREYCILKSPNTEATVKKRTKKRTASRDSTEATVKKRKTKKRTASRDNTEATVKKSKTKKRTASRESTEATVKKSKTNKSTASQENTGGVTLHATCRQKKKR